MLHYLDELMTAMNATPGRRWFNIASAVLTVCDIWDTRQSWRVELDYRPGSLHRIRVPRSPC